MKRIAAIIFLSTFALVAFAQNLTILHMNDTHSHVDPERGGQHAGHGGAIEQAAYIDSVRVVDGKENVLLLHAGDFSQGTSYFTELNGNIEIDILNAMEFDASCLGNHEFDNGMDELARRLGNLNVPVVCANYSFKGSPLDGLVKPYVILEKAGKKIGIIGLLTDVTSVVDKDIAAQLSYRNPAEAANEYAKILKVDQRCDLVICLTHLGFDGEPYVDTELAAQTRNVDVIVGGHSHTMLKDLHNVYNLDGEPVTIVTDWKWGLNIGNLKVNFTPQRLYGKYLDLLPEKVFSYDGSWFPYPAYSDREGWAEILGSNADYLISVGEKYIDYKWRIVPATAYLAYERTGERNIMQDPQSANRVALNALMLAELAEGKGRFVDQLVDGLWHLSNSPTWVLSAHLPRQKTKRSLPDPREQLIDLGSGALAAQVAVAWHFFHETFDKIDPVISYVIQDAVKKQILDPYLNTAEYRPNWWLGFELKEGQVVNNWNPWCNADVILCFLLMEKDPERLDHALRQSARSVDKFWEYVKSDGACEEGPAYWGHAAGKLYDYLKIMSEASDGRFSFFDVKQIKDMGEYISRSYVKNRWVVNFADASAQLSFSPSVVYNYGKAVGSPEMMDFAVYNLGNTSKKLFNTPRPLLSNDVFRSLESLTCINDLETRVNELNARIEAGESFDTLMESLRKSVPYNVWYPETEFCYMRNDDGWFVAMKGGHNNESHNHNDIGTFTLYADGVPMFVDAGVGTYTKQTFSKDRYTIWSMRSEWHNLPVINGVYQHDGAEFRSSDVSVSFKPKSRRFSLDISGAYDEEADCKYWKRDYQLNGNAMIITDTYSLKERGAADVENFLVQGDVYLPGDTTPTGYLVKNGETVVINSGKQMLLTYPVAMKPSVTVKELSDPRLTNVWGGSLRRISYTTDDNAPLKGKYVFTIKEL
jgi:hypothetical protein